MSITNSDPGWDYTQSQILNPSEALAFQRQKTGLKVFGAQIHTRKHLIAESIQTQAANRREIIRTTKNQAFEMSLWIEGNPINYTVDIRLQTIASGQTDGLSVCYQAFTVANVTGLYIPPDCVFYLQANSIVSKAFITLTPYITDSIIERIV